MNAVNDPKGEAGSKKAPMWLLPPVALEQTAWVSKFGAERYGPFNWRKTGVCATTYVSAIMRHLNAWRDGEDLDPESGISHIAHIATSCNILMDAAACGTLQDDRNKRPGGLSREEAFQKMASPPLTNLFEEDGRQMLDKLGEYVEINESPWIGLIDKTSDFSGIVDVPRPGQLKVGGKLVDLPPVPEGYDRWVDRGTGWSSGLERVPCFACAWNFSPGPAWKVYYDDTANGVDCSHYIEAVKDDDCQRATVAPLPGGRVKIVDHDLKAGDAAFVVPLHAYGFTTTIEKIVDIRGEKVYTFANGSQYTESELYTIAHA